MVIIVTLVLVLDVGPLTCHGPLLWVTSTRVDSEYRPTSPIGCGWTVVMLHGVASSQGPLKQMVEKSTVIGGVMGEGLN